MNMIKNQRRLMMRTLTIEKVDLEKAITRENEYGPWMDASSHCVVAQSVRRQWKKKPYCTDSGSLVKGTYVTTDAIYRKVIDLFDTEQYEILRRLLPVTITAEKKK
jgi:hypothetical protein